MECNAASGLLHAHIDGELAIGEAWLLDEHLRGCSACRARHAAAQSIHAAVSTHATRFQAPDGLLERIRDALPAARTRAAPKLTRFWYGSRFWMGWGNGAACAAALAIVIGIGIHLAQPNRDDRFAGEAVANHVRSMLADHAVEVASSDRHTVKPWFNGKLDYGVPVVDLSAQGFPLTGGRLDYLDHRLVAALVYRHRLHRITVFALPSRKGAERDTARTLSRRGYTVVRWSQAGMDLWAVSDVNARALDEFRALYLAEAGHAQ